MQERGRRAKKSCQPSCLRKCILFNIHTRRNAPPHNISRHSSCCWRLWLLGLAHCRSASEFSLRRLSSLFHQFRTHWNNSAHFQLPLNLVSIQSCDLVFPKPTHTLPILYQNLSPCT